MGTGVGPLALDDHGRFVRHICTDFQRTYPTPTPVDAARPQRSRTIIGCPEAAQPRFRNSVRPVVGRRVSPCGIGDPPACTDAGLDSTPVTIAVRPISADTHLASSRSSPRCPSRRPRRAGVSAEWHCESVGWFDNGDLVGTALVLHRQVPKVKRFLAYIPEGPVLPWDRAVTDLAAWLQPLLDHTKTKGAFALKMGPAVATRRWRAETVKAAIADDEVT